MGGFQEAQHFLDFKIGPQNWCFSPLGPLESYLTFQIPFQEWEIWSQWQPRWREFVWLLNMLIKELPETEKSKKKNRFCKNHGDDMFFSNEMHLNLWLNSYIHTLNWNHTNDKWPTKQQNKTSNETHWPSTIPLVSNEPLASKIQKIFLSNKIAVQIATI